MQNTTSVADGSAGRETAKGNKAATIRDVARLAGVSVATVSRFFNSPDALHEETARRVAEAMDRLDYCPRLAARNLSNRTTRTLGLLSEYLDAEFFLPLLTGMERAAYEHRYSLIVSSTRHWKDSAERILPLGPHNCDGALVFPDSVSEERLARWHRGGFPMVLIQHGVASLPNIPRVTIENVDSSEAALLHLASRHGAKRVLYLRGPLGHADAIQRYEGFLRGLGKAGLPYLPELVLDGSFNEDIACQACTDALDSGLVFDAVLAADDDSAMGALEALKLRGVAAPVIGFDGRTLGQRQRPPLATVLAPTEDVGYQAVFHLIGLLEGREVPVETQLTCSPRFRGSCGCT